MLLTVLETGNYKKIGDSREHHTDVRMIFATNADVEKMLNTGNFRRDFYFRICDNLIRIPPLRSHKEDIRGMIMHYLDTDMMITEDAIERLEDYNWPGNIRELHKCLKRACVNCNNNVITADSIDFGEINIPQ
jgi:transcriptional regulator with GAF, ATPase, and Fis domain